MSYVNFSRKAYPLTCGLFSYCGPLSKLRFWGPLNSCKTLLYFIEKLNLLHREMRNFIDPLLMKTHCFHVVSYIVFPQNSFFLLTNLDWIYESKYFSLGRFYCGTEYVSYFTVKCILCILTIVNPPQFLMLYIVCIFFFCNSLSVYLYSVITVPTLDGGFTWCMHVIKRHCCNFVPVSIRLPVSCSLSLCQSCTYGYC